MSALSQLCWFAGGGTLFPFFAVANTNMKKYEKSGKSPSTDCPLSPLGPLQQQRIRKAHALSQNSERVPLGGGSSPRCAPFAGAVWRRSRVLRVLHGEEQPRLRLSLPFASPCKSKGRLSSRSKVRDTWSKWGSWPCAAPCIRGARGRSSLLGRWALPCVLPFLPPVQLLSDKPAGVAE